jgi:hypothetical protein
MFLSPPSLDLSVSSFGGLDLSSVPGVYHWMNITLTWLMEQYTWPHYGTVDLRHYICPLCDAPPPLTPGEMMSDAMRTLAQVASEGVLKVRN